MNSTPSIPQVLKNLNIEQLNAMQDEAEYAILKDTNVFLIAPTGSGKTLAFLLPVLQLMSPEKKGVQCLVLAPTRELALQIEQVWKKMSTGYKVNVCYGGHDIKTEINNLSSAPSLLIGTPGRIVDHINRKSINPESISMLVLDEFDKSLEMGFQEQMEVILGRMKGLKKRVMVSATAKVEIPDFTGMQQHTVVSYKDKAVTKSSLAIRLVKSDSRDKLESLFKLICMIDAEKAIVFLNHREAAERVSLWLNEKGVKNVFYHGGMDQDERERALIRYRNGSVKFLITTDLAARGLDIPNVKHVIHYHLPLKETEFIHRNGRTARMNEDGTAYVILSEDDFRPDYIHKTYKELKLTAVNSLPESSHFETLYIGAGKKNKVNKVDIVGFLHAKGGLNKEDIGLIEVKDFVSFVAIKEEKIKKLLGKLKDEKLKGKKYKIALAK
jgi:ATP-dependent RNA helicase DbpA